MAELRIRTRNTAAGLAWVRAGLRLFARQPLVIVVMVALGPLLTWTVALVPVVGTAFGLILVPTMSIGMLAVCRAVERGEMPGLASYTAAMHDPVARLQLFKLGIYYALVFGVLATAWSLLPADAHPAAGSRPANPPAATATPDTTAAPDAPDLALTPMRLALTVGSLLLAIPLEMSMWFAPALVAWHQMPAGKALFFSFFACWRNRAPMLVYLLALSGLAFAAVLAFGALIGALNVKESIALYLLAPLPLSLLAISKTCALAIYRDVVEDGSPASDPLANPSS